MQAAISGIARKALIVDGESLKVFDVNEPTKLIDCRPSDVPYVFGEGRDVRFIENVNVESIAKELRSDSDLTLALDLTLISLDGELEEDIRKDAIRDLDELILDEHLTVRLEGIMYGRPLPEESDLESVLKACDDLRVPNASEFFNSLGRRQSLISNVSAAWDAIPTKMFGGDDQKTDFQRVAVQRALFRKLVTFLESGTNVTQFLLTAGLDATITQLRNSREVLQQWAAPFREAVRTLAITPDIDEELRAEKAPRRKRGRLVGLNRQALLRQVIDKKSIISAAIKRRDLEFARERVDDLVDFQRKSESEYLAKSLCDLAMEAKELGMYDLQLELTERSVGEAPADAWSWAQYGDALLRLRKFDEALYAFEQSENFGESTIAKNGRGEVLRAQGRLDEALSAFDAVIAEHSEDVFAKNGRAEVLKAQGRLDEALAAFDVAIAQHPENAVAKNGRAEVLKAQGRLDEALAAFDAAIGQHPEDVVGKNGRAEVLKAQGRLDDALAAFSAVIAEHPENVVASNGRAEVLKAQGRLDDALSAFDAVITQHPEDAVARTGRAEVLKAQGRFDDALAAFDAVITQRPEDVVAKTGRAELLKAMGRLDDALFAFNAVITQHPENLVAKNGRAEVLKAQGRLDDALSAFDAVVTRHPENAVAKTGRAEVLKAQGRLDDALGAFNAVIAQHPRDVFAKTGRAEALKAQGRLDDALAAFNAVIAQHPENAVAKTGRAEVLKTQGRLDDALVAFNVVIAQHPENVVAKTGRAEVLKAQGRFIESLAAYDEISVQYPHDEVARNGRSCVLAGLGRYDEALELLPIDHLLGFQDWIGFHIRGMVLMRMKKIEDAVKIFTRGIDENPFPTNRPYFQTALATALIQQRRYDAAEILLDGIKAPGLEPQIKVLHLHASGEEGHDNEARVDFEGLTPKPWSVSDELMDELHRRYILKAPAKHSDEWLLDQELNSLLLVSTQQTSNAYAF